MTGVSNELELGKAAEHIACADLILNGYRAYLSDQGLPYDIVLDLSGKLIRIQVKGCGKPKNVNSRGRSPRIAYNFHVRRCGKNGRSRLSDNDCDLVALVSLDTRQTAYLPISIVGQCVQISPDGQSPEVASWRYGWTRTMGQWPIEDALLGDSAYEKVLTRVQQTHCTHGHEYAVIGGRKDYGCPECNRIRARKNKSLKREGAI